MTITKENLEYLDGILNRTHDLIARCDQKISVVLAFLGTFLALFLNSDNLDTYKCICQKLDGCVTGYEIIYFLLFSVSVIICLVAFVLLALALMARIKSDMDNIEFFQCVKSLDQAMLKERFENYDDCGKFNAIVDSIYANYKIARKKYLLFNKGLRISVIGIVLLISIYLWGLSL